MKVKKKSGPFKFKQFEIHQDQCTMKVGTDGVLLGAWADVDNCQNILDIGAGTGLIAIMLGQRTQDQDTEIYAIEIDDAAAEQAAANANAAPWSQRLNIFQGAIQDYARSTDHKFDLIVSNPPFFSGGTFSDKQDRNDVRHTVKLPHGDLLIAVRTLLQENGKFCVILPLIEGLRFQELAAPYHLYCTKVMKVKPKKDKPVERLLLQFERNKLPQQTNELIIQKEARNDWTEDYIDLTKAFYLKM
ncbi:MAG: tRNA1(Val) (adenine(37)-N6)-methyltransferase [Saprospiraceae bacterium]